MEAATIEETELERKQRERAEAEAEGVPGEESGLDSSDEAGEPASEDAAAEGEGDKPGEGEGEEAPPALAITPGGQLNLQVGGAKPDKSTVKLRGGSIEIAGGGQLKKGEVRNILVKVRIDEVHFVDKHDNQTGDLTQAERRHIAKMIGVELVE